MCVAFWALQHPDYALPTVDAHFHAFDHGGDSNTKEACVLSGRDVRAGGTWLGVNYKSGRIALLTNIAETPAQYSTSRGHLVSSFLLSDTSLSLENEIGKSTPRNAKYAGFNLLLLAPSSSTPSAFDSSFVTNDGGGGMIRSRALSARERCFGGMSNGVLGDVADEWRKVRHGIEYIKILLDDITPETKEAQITDRLFELLNWRSPEPIPDRSNTILVDPIPVDLTGAPGSQPDYYGTRLSTVLIIRRNGEGLFIERDAWTLDADGRATRGDPRSDRVYRFQIQLGKVS